MDPPKRKKWRFDSHLDTYKSNFTTHGLSFLFTRCIIERIFWGVCMLNVLGFAGYMTWLYTTRYLSYNIRTEIRFEERKAIELPVVTICSQKTFWRYQDCYQNTSLLDGTKCGITYDQGVSSMRYSVNHKWIEGTYLGWHCYAFNENGTIAIAGQTEFIELEYKAPQANDDILVILRSPADFQARRSIAYFTYSNAYLNVFRGIHEYYIEKSQIRRKEKPYPSNCSKEHSNGNMFSYVYTEASCHEMCAMEHMYAECNDVIDIWKQYLTKPAIPFDNKAFKDRDECLVFTSDKLRRRLPENCACNLACNETLYTIRERFTTGQLHNGVTHKLYLYYGERKVTSITEVADYKLEDLLAAFGGMLGLCIGMSVLSFVELFVYLVLFCLNRFT